MSQICLQKCQRLFSCESVNAAISGACPQFQRECRPLSASIVRKVPQGYGSIAAIDSRFGTGRRLRNHLLTPCSSQKKAGALLGARVEKDMDLCKDLVNVPTTIVNPKESTSEKLTVTFLGAGGVRKALPVPKDVFILDAAIDAGIDLPWSCRGGICGTCVGKVVKGAVDQSDIADLTFTLEQKDIDDGMALLCMSRPLEDCEIETQSDWGYLMGITEWKGATGNINNAVVNEWKALSDD